MTETAMQPLRQLVDPRFVTEPVGAAGVTAYPADARWTVIIDAALHPIGLERADDTTGPTSPSGGRMSSPAVVVDGSATLEDFAASPALTLLDLDPLGLVVTADAGIEGVIPVDVVDAYLADRTRMPSRTQGPHGTTDGDGHEPLIGHSRVVCHWPGCGKENKLVFYDRHRTLCVNKEIGEHPLTPSSAR